MPKITYVEKRFGSEALALIEKANEIIADYESQGYRLTLRQLYYNFVTKLLIENTMKSYKRLGNILNDARLAGLVDWNALEDRTREVISISHWSSPRDILKSASDSYRLDKWQEQMYRPEVWIEKEALAGVMEQVCAELDIPFLACRGYTSQSEMWASAMRLKRIHDNGQIPVIFHFGDHDPSGIDMTRDITDRLEMFTGGIVQVNRIALTMKQVDAYKPPPNPAKVEDTRFKAYMNEYGDESWELDALEPSVLAGLVRDNVVGLRDELLWDKYVKMEEQERNLLFHASSHWNSLVPVINSKVEEIQKNISKNKGRKRGKKVND